MAQQSKVSKGCKSIPKIACKHS